MKPQNSKMFQYILYKDILKNLTILKTSILNARDPGIERLLKGVGGGLRSNFVFNLILFDCSKNLEYVALGTFYRTERALPLLRCDFTKLGPKCSLIFKT